MKRSDPTPVFNLKRRTRWILLALLAVVVPLALLSQSGSAQKSRVSREEDRPARAGKKTGRSLKTKTPELAAPAGPKAFRQPSQRLEPVSSEALNFAESRPLAEVAKEQPKASPKRLARGEEEDGEAAENAVTRRVSPQALAAASVRGGLRVDTAIQALDVPAPSIPTPIVTFEGLGRTENIAAGFGNLSPPDTNGDVGPNHYVQMDNDLVRVWNKAGTPLTSPFKLSTLFVPLGGQCAAPDRGDPVVLYDQLADRWMLSQFAYASQTGGVYHECIAVSKTNDPAGAYYLYDFQTAGNEFPDYPHLGVWPDGYYMMVHQFTAGGPFNGTGVYSFNRLKMLAGDPTANYIYFSLNLTNFPEAIGGMLPSDLDGVTPPPVGRPNTFAYFTTTDFSDPANGLRLFDFHADFATPANSTFTERAETTYAAPLAVAPFSVVTPTGNQGRQAVPQPSPAAGATTALDAITDRLMHRMQYRNQGGYETLVMTHTVGAPASTTFGTFRAAPRYYELRSTAGGPFAVQEQATYAPGGPAPGDNVSRWMGSAAEDNQGNLALGFSVSSGAAGGNVFPGIRYAGRLATDPAGSLAQGEATLIAGTGVQRSTGNRWGDYSALTLDPSDDCTFWFTSEYYTSAGQAASTVGWQTRIGSFKFAQCTAPAKGTAHFTVTNCDTNGPVANATITIDGTTYGVTASDGTYNATLAPGSHSYLISKPGYSGTASGNVSITDGNTTNASGCIVGSPSLASNGSTIQVESCAPGNGAIDPGETVTVNFCVKNNGGGNTTNLVGTLLEQGGVTSPDGPKTYGVVTAEGGTSCQAFTFTASVPDCGSPVVATIHLQDGANDLGNVVYNFQTGIFSTVLSENFDGVTAPALPAGWTASAGSGTNLWATSATGSPTPVADTAPNSAFVSDLGSVSDQRLDSPSVFVSASDAQLTFRHNYVLESGFDGGVLEISLDGGAFSDIVTAGGTFVAGGYSGAISNVASNQSPIQGRPAWTGTSGGFITTTVNLPAAAAGHNVVLRWRLGSDNLVSGTGWRVDTISLKGAHLCCGFVPTPTPTPTPTPSPTPTPTPGPCNPLTEGFDDITTLTGAGWAQVNHSDGAGSTGWFQGNPDVFPAHEGAATNSYIGANYNNTTGTSTISNWLVMPTMSLRDGNTLTFWTRTTDVGASLFPDRLQVRMSTNFSSTNVGSTSADVGDFTTLLLDINPTYADAYPHDWTKYTVTISGLGGNPVIGRLAFRYFVEGGGPTGNNSDYIGIDSVQFSCKQDQTITFGALADKTFGDPDFQLTATASSGLTVNYTSTGNCTVTGDMVHLTGAGSCTITAHQPGDASYNAAPDVQQSFNIAKGTPAITWSNPADITYPTALGATQLNATANTPGTFTYTPASGTVLGYGSHNLHVDFTPTDTANYNNASKDVSINVLSAVLNLSMTADRNPAPVGLNMNYKPVISNTGNASATNVTLTDALPSLVTFTAVSSSQGSCVYDSLTKTVTCNLGTIPAGFSANVQITVKPRDEGTLNDTATITGGQWDTATGNSSASVNGIPAVKQVDLSVQKTNAPDPIFVGQNTVYTMVVKNNSTVLGATGVVLTDTLPASMTFVSASTTQGSLVTPPVGSTGIVTANIGSLAVGATATVTLTAKSTISGLPTNTATVTGNESDPVSSNNTASSVTTVKDVLLQKVLLAKQVLTGGCENTTGNVYLTGPAPAGGLMVPLSTTSLAGVTVPANVLIPAGSTVSPAFGVTTSPVATKQVGLVNAGSGMTAVSRSLTINVGSGTCPP